MQRSMATEAEAAREARAKVISAEGEHKASTALRNAADIISGNPVKFLTYFASFFVNVFLIFLI